MILFIAALLILSLVGIRFAGKDGFEDYMSPQKTGSVKGLFVIIVFFSHIRQYCSPVLDSMNKPYYDFLNWFGQLMVVMFLFYSGYGVYLAIQKKDRYIKTIPAKRIFKVWYHFALAIVLYLLLGIAMGKIYTPQRFFESLIGKSDLGNSSWFIMTILLLYLATFIGFIFIGREHMLAGTVVTTALTVLVVIWLMKLKGDSYWWYDTALCYPLGMWYAMAKPKLDQALMHDFGKWFSASAITLIVFYILKFSLPNLTRSRHLFFFTALAFAMLIALISMRISVDNAVLRWFGKHIMGIYILQRIPMIYFQSIGLNQYPKVYLLCCFAATLLIAWGFDAATDKLDILLHLSPKRSGAGRKSKQ